MLVGRVRRTRRTRTCRPLAQTMYRGERNVIRVTDPGSVDRPCGSVLIGVCDRDIIREGPFMWMRDGRERPRRWVRRAWSSVASAHCFCESRGTLASFC